MLEVVVDYITKNPIRMRDTSQSPIGMRDTLPSSVNTKHTPPSPKRSGIPRRSPVQSRKHSETTCNNVSQKFISNKYIYLVQHSTVK